MPSRDTGDFLKVVSWQWGNFIHTRQSDSINCALLCIMFTENKVITNEYKKTTFKYLKNIIDVPWFLNSFVSICFIFYCILIYLCRFARLLDINNSTFITFISKIKAMIRNWHEDNTKKDYNNLNCYL